MTNLEQLLQSDSGQEQKEAIVLKFKQAQSAVKRQLDLGCAPMNISCYSNSMKPIKRP